MDNSKGGGYYKDVMEIDVVIENAYNCFKTVLKNETKIATILTKLV